MSDLVKRLRERWRHSRDELSSEAADEIERLVTENERLRGEICEAVNGLSDPCDACDFPSEADALRTTIGAALHYLRRALEGK